MTAVMRANAQAMPNYQREPNLCAMQIDGERVWVDIENINFEAGIRAAVIDNGRIRIQRIEPFRNDYRPMGDRSAYGEAYDSGRGTACRTHVVVIGAVVNPNDLQQISGNVIEGELAA